MPKSEEVEVWDELESLRFRVETLQALLISTDVNFGRSLREFLSGSLETGQLSPNLEGEVRSALELVEIYLENAIAHSANA